MNTLSIVLNLMLFALVARELVRLHRETRQPLFPWLAIPLLLLPFLSLPISHAIKGIADRFVLAEKTGAFPLTLVESGRMGLGELLVLWNGVSHIVWSATVLLALRMKRKAG
jgi:hypothetical protein